MIHDKMTVSKSTYEISDGVLKTSVSFSLPQKQWACCSFIQNPIPSTITHPNR